MANLQQIKEKILKAKKGIYHHMEWQSVVEINGSTYTKISSGSVRFVDYYKLTNKTKPLDYVDTIIKVNKKGQEYVQFYTTGKQPKVKFYCNGSEITKEQYISMVQPKPSKVDLMFNKRLSDIIAFR